MSEIFFKILGLLKDGLSAYGNQKAKVFRDFVEPAFNDFGKIHADYLESLSRYLKVLDSDDMAFDESHPIFQMIEDDSILSAHLRNNGYSFYGSDSKKYETFASSIYDYLIFSCSSSEYDSAMEDSEYEHCRNYVRHGAYVGLKAIVQNGDYTDEQKRQQAKTQIRGTINKLQQKHRNVVDEYNALKAELL